MIKLLNLQFCFVLCYFFVVIPYGENIISEHGNGPYSSYSFISPHNCIAIANLLMTA